MYVILLVTHSCNVSSLSLTRVLMTSVFDNFSVKSFIAWTWMKGNDALQDILCACVCLAFVLIRCGGD